MMRQIILATRIIKISLKETQLKEISLETQRINLRVKTIKQLDYYLFDVFEYD